MHHAAAWQGTLTVAVTNARATPLVNSPCGGAGAPGQMPAAHRGISVPLLSKKASMTLRCKPAFSLLALNLRPPGPLKGLSLSLLSAMAFSQAASTEWRVTEKGQGRDGQKSRGEGQGHRDGNDMPG